MTTARPGAVDVSVIVVSWNTRALLERCLASVQASLGPPDRETWVVDNASTDGSADMVRAQFPWARLIANSTNVGFARANNQALRQTDSEYCLLLNPDAELRPETLPRLWAWMGAHPRAGIAGPTLKNPDGSFQSAQADFPTLAKQLVVLAGLAPQLLGRYFPSHGPSAATDAVAADWIGGACMLVRRAAILDVGLLDEDFFWSGEEMDWCYRMKQAGWGVHVIPMAECLHWGGQSSRQASEFTLARLAAGMWRFFRKHYGGPPSWLLRLGMLALGLLKAVVFGGLALVAGARRAHWTTKARANLRLAGAGLQPYRWVEALPTAAGRR